MRYITLKKGDHFVEINSVGNKILCIKWYTSIKSPISIEVSNETPNQYAKKYFDLGYERSEYEKQNFDVKRILAEAKDTIVSFNNTDDKPNYLSMQETEHKN